MAVPPVPVLRFAQCLAVAVLAGLTGSAMALAAPPVPEDPVVARVGSWDIHASDLERLSEVLPTQAGPPGAADAARYLSAAVREELLFQWTVGGMFRGDRALRDKLKAVVVQHIVETQVRPRVRVTNADIRRYYEDNLDLVRGGHVRARRIHLRQAGGCDPLRREIDSEAAFIEAAKRLSQDRDTAESGGDLGYLLPTDGPLGFERQLFAMRPGEMRVFKGTKGCDLVRLVEKTDPPIPPLSEVQDSLRAYLESRQEERYLDDLVAEASKVVKVRLFLKRPVPAASPGGGAAKR